jgi:glycosyltransferase involved in cell wall biosynthesis
MRILLMIARSPYDDYMGGAENFVRSVAERLAGRHEVHVLTRKLEGSLPDTEEINSVRLHRYRPRRIPKLSWLTEPSDMYREGIGVARRHSVDIVFPCILYPTGYVGVKIAEKLGKPSILSLQNAIFDSDLGGLYSGKKAAFALKKATKIHVISRYLKKNLNVYEKRKDDDVVVVYDGFDEKLFNPSLVDRKGVGRKYGKGYPLIVNVSHYKYPQKRQDILVRSMPDIISEYPDAMLLLAGKGDYSHVKKWSDRLGLKKNVKFLGYRPPSEVRDLIGASDIFAFPTEFEGMGIVAVEALALGVPVVATNVGPLPELVRPGKDGWLTGLDVKEFAGGILKTLKDKKLMRGRTGRMKWARKNFSWDIAAKELEKVMESMTR